MQAQTYKAPDCAILRHFGFTYKSLPDSSFRFDKLIQFNFQKASSFILFLMITNKKIGEIFKSPYIKNGESNVYLESIKQLAAGRGIAVGLCACGGGSSSTSATHTLHEIQNQLVVT